MKILLTGSAGMLGRKMVEVLAPDHDVVATARNEDGEFGALDVTRLDEVRATVRSVVPEVIVNCAAFTAVDDCETKVDLAYQVNALGPRNVAIAAEECGAAVLHFSTDYVFDGEQEEPYLETDGTNPISSYGRSKLAGEDLVRDLTSRWYIARIQWLFGEHGPNFAATMLRLAAEKPELRVVDDQWGCPTYTGDVARQAKSLLESGEYGLYHMSAGGETSWYGFTRALLEADGTGDFPVTPVETSEFPRPAPRPKNSVMRNRNLELTIGNGMRPWEEGMKEYLENRG